MAKISNPNYNLSLTSSGISQTVYHHEGGRFKISFSLDKDLNFSMTAYDHSYTSSGYFNYRVGYRIVDSSSNQYAEAKLFTLNSSGNISFSTKLSNCTFPLTIQFICQGCTDVNSVVYTYTEGKTTINMALGCVISDYSNNDNMFSAEWKVTDDRHTHESAPSAPTLSNITCNSITVTGGEYVREGGNGTWYSSPHIFTGYGHNTSHTYYAANYCSCGEYFVSSSRSGTTLSKEAKPSIDISSSTGKTITVSGGEQAKLGSGSWQASHAFTGLTQGTEYTFYVRNICVCGEATDSASANYKTWNISGRCTSQTTKTLTFEATHVAGSGGNASAKNIVYQLYKSDKTTAVSNAITKSNGTAATFSGLDPNTSYYCKVYTEGMSDNDAWISGTTKQRFSIGTLTLDVSAKSIRAKQTWTVNGSTGIECSITCNGKTKTITTNGEYVVFNDDSDQGNISPGTNYTISIYIIDDEDNTSTKSDSIETKKATINTIASTDITSKIIEVSGKSNYSGDKMELKINSGSWNEKNQNTKHRFNNLTHNTSHTIYCRIKDCFKYSITDGSVTTTNDSEISVNKSSYQLSLTGSISEEHQHQIITLWQAKVNGTNINEDAIDGTDFTFVINKIKTIAKKNYPPYQSSQVTEGINGTISANYQLDRKIYSNSLKWYYCEYQITGAISDGYNEVTNTIIAHTTFPYTWKYDNINKKWNRYMPYIYTDKVTGKKDWIPAPVFIADENNNFIESNGE